MRKWIECNISAGRKALSSQTGFVHHCYEAEGERHDSIPLYENFCFALALLRTRQSDSVLEGKAFIEKLLPFEIDGNFPIYLHDFPKCNERSLSLRLLPLFHAIQREFHAVLGHAFIQQIEELMGRIASHGYRIHQQRPLSKGAECLLKAYVEPESAFNWHPETIEEWSDYAIAWQMVKTPLPPLPWNPKLALFTGVSPHRQLEPRATLFDLFMAERTQHFPKRLLQEQPIHLRAALIDPAPEHTAPLQELPTMHHILSTHPCQPYTLYFGMSDQVHSLVLDAKEIPMQMVSEKGRTDILFSLPSTYQEGIELSFFLDLHPHHEITINGKKATAFQLGDQIEICSGEQRITLSFSLIRGKGTCFGHLLRGNRPLQTDKTRFQVYDWQIGLRAVSREEPCVLKATVFS